MRSVVLSCVVGAIVVVVALTCWNSSTSDPAEGVANPIVDLAQLTHERAEPPTPEARVSPQSEDVGSLDTDREPVATTLAHRVISESGSAIEGASVRAYDLETLLEIGTSETNPLVGVARAVGAFHAESRTDHAGGFEIPGVGTDLHVVRAPGFSTAFLEAGGAWPEDIVLRPSPGIHGAVRSALDLSPVANAKIVVFPLTAGRAFSNEERGRFWALGDLVSTDSRGQFVLGQTTDGWHRVNCVAPDFSEVWLPWTEPSDQPLEILLQRGREFAGIVVDENDEPVPGAALEFIVRGTRPVPTQSTHSDEDGCWVYPSAPAGATTLFVKKAGFATWSQCFDDQAMFPDFLEVRLQPEAELAGRVVDDRGDPLVGAHIEVISVDQFARVGGMDTEDGGHWYMITTPSESRVIVFADMPGHRSVEGQLVDVPDTDVELMLPRHAELEIVTRDEAGEPIREFSTMIVPVDDRFELEKFYRGSAKWEHHASDDGTAVVEAWAGPMELSVAAPGHATEEIRDLIVQPGASIRLPVELEQAAVIRGQVLDEQASGVAGIEIGIAPRSTNGRSMMPVNPSGVTGTDGTFSVEVPAQEQFLLALQGAGFGAKLVGPVSVRDFPRNLVLERAGAVFGNADTPWTDPSSTSVVRISAPGTWFLHEVAVDANGDFQFPEVAPGDYLVELYDEWSAGEHAAETVSCATVEVRSGETTYVTLSSRAAGVIRGQLDIRSSHPPAAFWIRALDIESRGVVAQSALGLYDTYSLFGLEPGRYEVQVTAVHAGTLVDLRREVDLTARQEVDGVDFVIEDRGLSGRVFDVRGDPADAFVALIDGKRGRFLGSARTDVEGRYHVLDVPDGDFVVCVTAPGCAEECRVDVPWPADGVVLEHRLTSESRLWVRVEDDLGAAVAGAQVSLVHSVRPRVLPPMVERSSLDSVLFSNLPAGTAQLRAERSGYVPAEETAPLVAGGERSVTLRLVRMGSLEVTVLDANGVAVSDLLVSVEPDTNAVSPTPAPRRTNRAGAVRFNELAPGLWSVSAPGCESTTVGVPPGATASAELQTPE